MSTATQTPTEGIKYGKITLTAFGNVVKSEDIDKKWESVPVQPTPTPEQENLMKMLNDRLSLAKAQKTKKHDIWNYSYLQYRSVNYYSMLYGGYPTYWNSWGMGVFIPRTFEAVEATKAQMMKNVPDFTITDTMPLADPKKGNTMQYLMQSEWNRSHIQDEIAETVHDCLVYGTGLIRTDVINDKRPQMTLKWKENDKGVFVVDYVSETVQRYYGIGGRRIDPYDFYPNPSPEAFKMKNLGWCFERSVVDAWELRTEYEQLATDGAYGITDGWKYIKPGGDVTNYKYLRDEVNSLYTTKADQRYPATINDLVGRTSTTFGLKMVSGEKGKIEVWEYFEDDRWIVIAGSGIILRDSPNPYPHKKIPVCKYNLIDMNEFWSTGYPEIMRWLQVAENILYDQGLNNIIMSVHKMFAVNTRYLEDEGELVVRPFGIIHMKQIPNVKISDAIMPIEYTHNMENYFNFMERNEGNIKSLTGVSEMTTGGTTETSDLPKTATATNRLAAAMNSRIGEISRHMEDSLVKNVVEQLVENVQFYYQNIPQDTAKDISVKVNDPSKSYYMKFLSKDSGDITEQDIEQAKTEGFTGIIAQDHIQGRYDVAIVTGDKARENPEADRENIMSLLKFAQDINATSMNIDPKTGQASGEPVFDIKAIAEDALKKAFDVTDTDRYAYKAPVAQETAPATEVPPAGGAPITNNGASGGNPTPPAPVAPATA